jgi:hypothetical protein
MAAATMPRPGAAPGRSAEGEDLDEITADIGGFRARMADRRAGAGAEHPAATVSRSDDPAPRDAASGAAPRSGGESGVRVVRVLEALQRSLDRSSRAAPV